MENELTGAAPTETEAAPAVEAETVTDAQEDGQEANESPEPQRKDRAAKRIARLVAETHALRRQLEAISQRNGQTAAPAEADAETRAQQIIAEQEFINQSNALHAQGVKEFPQTFQSAVDTLNSVVPGGLGAKRDFLDAVLALPNGHAVINALGNDVESAVDILELSPTRMAIELAKISGKLANSEKKPAAKAISKAPPPPSPVTGPAVVSSGDPSKMTMAEYMAWREAERKKAGLQ